MQKDYIRLGSDGVFTFGIMSCFWSKLTLAPSSNLMVDSHEAIHLLSMTSIYDFWLVEHGNGAILLLYEYDANVYGYEKL